MLTNRITILEDYLKDDPNDSFTLYALALEYVAINDAEKAQKLFSTVVKEHPDYLASYYHYGRLLEKLGNKEQASEIYTKGRALARKQNQQKTLSEIKEAYNSLNGTDDEE